MYGDATHMIHKKSLPDSSAGLIRNSSLFLLIFGTAILLMTSTALGEVTDLDYSPDPPSPGDTVTITGIASSDDISDGQLPVSVVFGKTESVSDGTFDFVIEAITIPPGTESLSLTAEGVDSLDIEVSFDLFGVEVPIEVPGKYVTVTDNVASFSTGKIKSGTYKMRLHGDSSFETVSLKFGGKGHIDDVSAGETFEYPYTLAEDMPEEMFVPENVLDVAVGGSALSIPLGTTDDSSNDGDSSSSSSSSSKKKSSSHTGTELNIVPAESLGDDTEKSSGVGDEIDTKASTQDSGSESPEGDTDTGEVDGYILENKSSSGIQTKIPELGVMGAVVGVLCLGALFIGFRKNRYK